MMPVTDVASREIRAMWAGFLHQNGLQEYENSLPLRSLRVIVTKKRPLILTTQRFILLKMPNQSSADVTRIIQLGQLEDSLGVYCSAIVDNCDSI